MPCLPTSRERPLAQAWIAALAQKAPLMPSGSDLPVMLMMRPHLRAIIWSSSACVSWRWRVKLSVIASCHCSSVASILKGAAAAGVVDEDVDGAQPVERRLGDARRRALLHEVLDDQHRLGAARGHDLAGQLLEQLGAPRDDSQAHALARQRQGDAAADADAGAGHQRGLAFETEVHGRPLCVACPHCGEAASKIKGRATSGRPERRRRR